MIASVNLQKELSKLQVIALYVFGSRAAGGNPSPMSDYDFAFLLDPKKRDAINDPTLRLELYQQLYQLLTAEYEISFDTPVDIIFLQADQTPLELKANVIRTGELLFDADPTTRANFESYLALLAADMQPIREMMDQATLERIK